LGEDGTTKNSNQGRRHGRCLARRSARISCLAFSRTSPS
jgi:hypothetical protein